jgi:hypothetical protein
MKVDMEQFHRRLLDCFPPKALPPERVYGGSPERAAVDDEVQELCSLAGGKSWLELGIKECRTLAEYLSLMSDEAFVAYLPAFLEGAILDLDAGYEGIMSLVVSILCPQRVNGRTDEFVASRVKLFNEQQSRLIAEWLDQLKKLRISDFLAEDVNCALRSYWGQWLIHSETAKSW